MCGSAACWADKRASYYYGVVGVIPYGKNRLCQSVVKSEDYNPIDLTNQ
jgi:hypothetical protein